RLRMSTRSLLRAPPLFCAAVLVACADERSAAPPLAPPSFSRQGEPAAPAASRFYQQHNLVSDGAVPADLVDPNLVNAWGLVSSPTSPWWISDNGTGRSTLYNVNTGNILYASNFHAGTVHVFDNHFNPVHMAGAFTDPHLPAGYAPFGIQNIGGTIYVTYALQDADRHDDVSGEGHGFVDAFDTRGKLIRR